MKIIGSDKGIHSPEFHKKKTREMRVKQVLYTLLVLIIIGLPIYLLRTEKYLITSIEVSGNDVTKSEDIQRIIGENLSGNYFWIFPHSNTVLYPEEKIKKDLLTKEPRLSSVTITNPSAKELKVVVTERAPLALYCKNVVNASAPENCYFVDDTGYIFASAPAFSGNVYLTYATGDVYEEPIGHSVLPAEEFNNTFEFAKHLGDVGIYPRVFLVKNDEYRAVLANGAEVMWSRSASLKDVMAGLSSFLNDKSVKGEKDFLSKVLYIDMRFGNKIFYKFRGEL